MAHFANIDDNNFVLRVIVIDNEKEEMAEQYIKEELGLPGRWMQTSYNTKGGIHYNPETGEPSENQSKSFRKNYAGIGFTFDEELDAFIPPKPFSSWILNEETCLWEPPIPMPETGGPWIWNEELVDWEEIPSE